MLQYKAPIDGQDSTINGTGANQVNTVFWLRKSIVTARKLQYFTQLATVKSMPKHMGKTMTVYEYVPLLSDKNTYNQGIDAAGVATVNGNLYGSSKDIGTIVDRLPTLTENGGRVNRVGFTRLERRGSLEKLGFFTEFTAESLNFDSDDMLKEHLSRELLNGAVEMSESMLQIDLLTSAGVTVQLGNATDDDEISAEGGANAAKITYPALMRLDRILTDNLTPKNTTVITGSRYTDTRTVPAARIMYASPEMVAELMDLKNQFDEPAFIPLQKYADGGTALLGEVGAIAHFRIIEVPNMLHWAGAGAVVGTNPGFRSTTVGGQNRYDVFPLLVVGDESFVTIGFQTDGKSMKFDITTKMPGKETADKSDPYGETGFSSIKWYYGILIMRPERIGVIKAVARI